MNKAIEEIQLPKEEFCSFELSEKYEKGILRDHLDAVNYIQQYYFQTNRCNFYRWDQSKNEFEIRSEKDIKFEVFKKIKDDKDVKKAIIGDLRVFKIVSDIHNPRVYKIKNRYFIGLRRQSSCYKSSKWCI